MMAKKICFALLVVLSIFFLSTCDLPTNLSWLYGSWINTTTPTPVTHVTKFLSNGTLQGYNDYNETILSETGTWEWVAGDTFYIDLGTGSIPYTIVQNSTNQITLTFMGFMSFPLYRKSAYPIVEISATTLIVDESWLVSSIALNEEKWYVFSAAIDSDYNIEWDDGYDGSGGYDGDIYVSVYSSDFSTIYFEHEDSGYTFPPLITAEATGDIYILVDGYDPGNFAIRVSTP